MHPEFYLDLDHGICSGHGPDLCFCLSPDHGICSNPGHGFHAQPDHEKLCHDPNPCCDSNPHNGHNRVYHDGASDADYDLSRNSDDPSDVCGPSPSSAYENRCNGSDDRLAVRRECNQEERLQYRLEVPE